MNRGSIDRDLVNFDNDRKLTVTKLNNRLRCVLCTNILKASTSSVYHQYKHHSKYNRKFRF